MNDRYSRYFRFGAFTAGVVLALFSTFAALNAAAAPATVRQATASTMHPVFALLDANGGNVLESKATVSTMKTCGQCHDTDYIEKHNFHSDLGLTDITTGTSVGGQSWDYSRGMFGKWDPLTYRYLSQTGDGLLDLGTPEWVMKFGARMAGGGPATIARNGASLLSLPADANDPQTAVLDPKTGRATAWNWADSGVEESDCFLCHMTEPNNKARSSALAAGQFAAANTATLDGTGIVTVGGDGVPSWNAEAFDSAGLLLPQFENIQDPSNANCAQCHGMVHTDDTPLTLSACSLDNPQTAVTGQIIAPQRISESGMNISGKDALARPWDIHAQRGLACVDCHYSLNNPVTYQESSQTKPKGLVFDPRRISIGDYLKNPDHNIARGQSAQFTVEPSLKGTMRRCESCHDGASIHADWLPYTEKHLGALACESCHIPALYAPAIQQYDWTVITESSQAASVCRGAASGSGSNADLISGFTPALLMRTNVDGQKLISPYNLVTSWYWVYNDAKGNTRPVRLADLQAVYLSAGRYTPEIMNAFDYDGNGSLDPTELRIDSDAKKTLVAGKLAALGLGDPRIVGQVQPYSVNHDVAGKGYATESCSTCHSDASRLSSPMQLASYVPAGVQPAFVTDSNVNITGSMYVSDASLYYQPDPASDGLYIFGHSRYGIVDWIGMEFILLVILVIAMHTLQRVLSARKLGPRRPRATENVYMYQAYERFWHWLQTALILILLATGLIIHRPDIAGWLSFRGMVTLHNISAGLLVLNAVLSLFYHLTTGQIRQFIPRPYGFFDDAIVQAKYYAQGIFKRAPHPFEKTPERKLNPLQQATYFGILNVLLPLQILGGTLMWGAQNWPAVAAALGGLPVLSAAHALVAWLFAGFVIAHVYLTTTGGPGPLDSIQAMVTGWETQERHTPQSGGWEKE